MKIILILFPAIMLVLIASSFFSSCSNEEFDAPQLSFAKRKASTSPENIRYYVASNICINLTNHERTCGDTCTVSFELYANDRGGVVKLENVKFLNPNIKSPKKTEAVSILHKEDQVLRFTFSMQGYIPNGNDSIFVKGSQTKNFTNAQYSIL